MNLSAEQVQLAAMIDAHVNRFPDSPTGDEQLLPTTYDYMGAFKRVMDTSTSEQMDYLCQEYAGFYRFARLLETIAQAIADGEIEVPQTH
tara:strand:- start:1967 stop:2236 length:270 start_codon:yes stop_codon:yes gene_type:complete